MRILFMRRFKNSIYVNSMQIQEVFWICKFKLCDLYLSDYLLILLCNFPLMRVFLGTKMCKSRGLFSV